MEEDFSGKKDSDIVALNDEDRVAEVLRDSIMGLWEVVINLTRIRRTRRSEFRVTIFGSARIPKNHRVYGAVRDLARELASMGYAIVTGRGPGLMEAANEGAAQAGPAPGNSVGIRQAQK